MTLKVKGGSSDCASLPYERMPNRVISARMKITSAWCRSVQLERLKRAAGLCAVMGLCSLIGRHPMLLRHHQTAV